MKEVTCPLRSFKVLRVVEKTRSPALLMNFKFARSKMTSFRRRPAQGRLSCFSTPVRWPCRTAGGLGVTVPAFAPADFGLDFEVACDSEC